MTTYRFANNALTTLGSAISPTATTIVVASGTGAQFPSPAAGQYFTATLFASGSSTGLPNEIVRVTSRTGDTMTVVRGQEGTTAQAWDVGDTFSNFITAGFLNQLVDSSAIQAQAGNYAVDAGTANAGVITPVPVFASFAALIGVPLRIKKSGATNTGAYTLNVNSLGAGAVRIGGQPLEGGELIASAIFEVVYNGLAFDLISNPGTLHGDRITGNSVINAALAQMTTLTLKGNLSGGTATPYDVPLADLAAALGLSGNTEGVIYLPGGYIMQYGADYRPGIPQGLYTTSFNVPFPNAVTNAVTNVIKDNGDLGAGGDIFTQWRKSSTSLSVLAWTLNDTGGTSGTIRADGMSWVAFGR